MEKETKEHLLFIYECLRGMSGMTVCQLKEILQRIEKFKEEIAHLKG